MTKHLAALALAAFVFAACEPNRATEPQVPIQSSLIGPHDDHPDDGPRAVYTITNQVARNAVAVFARAAYGTLTAAATLPTGGPGPDADLASPGPGALCPHHR